MVTARRSLSSTVLILVLELAYICIEVEVRQNAKLRILRFPGPYAKVPATDLEPRYLVGNDSDSERHPKRRALQRLERHTRVGSSNFKCGDPSGMVGRSGYFEMHKERGRAHPQLDLLSREIGWILGGPSDGVGHQCHEGEACRLKESEGLDLSSCDEQSTKCEIACTDVAKNQGVDTRKARDIQGGTVEGLEGVGGVRALRSSQWRRIFKLELDDVRGREDGENVMDIARLNKVEFEAFQVVQDDGLGRNGPDRRPAQGLFKRDMQSQREMCELLPNRPKNCVKLEEGRS
jgi:hypothetical protein